MRAAVEGPGCRTDWTRECSEGLEGQGRDVHSIALDFKGVMFGSRSGPVTKWHCIPGHVI